MDFPPILVLAIIWLLIGLPLSRLNKVAKQQQAAKNAKSGAAKTGTKAPKTEPRMSGPAQPEVTPARHTVLQPTITFTEHDDSVYQGSLNAVTGEGFDPCHDEQLSPLSAAERETVSAPGEEAPGLQLGWTGSDVVRGFVMSEILNRRKREAS